MSCQFYMILLIDDHTHDSPKSSNFEVVNCEEQWLAIWLEICPVGSVLQCIRWIVLPNHSIM